jgi:hypothetical protein
MLTDDSAGFVKVYDDLHAFRMPLTRLKSADSSRRRRLEKVKVKRSFVWCFVLLELVAKRVTATGMLRCFIRKISLSQQASCFLSTAGLTRCLIKTAPLNIC